MPIFDIHAYLEGYSIPGINQTADQLWNALQPRGITNVVLFSARAGRVDPLSGNRVLKSMVEPHAALYAGITAHTGRADASVQAIKELLGSKKFVGTLVVGNDPEAPLHPLIADEILNACRRYQKPIFLLTPNAACIETAHLLAKQYSMHRFVFLGMGGKDWQNAVAVAHQTTNVMLEVSGELDNAKIIHAVNVLGAHRVLFGSGAPHQDPIATMGLLAEAGLSSANLQRVLFENANKLFGITE